MASQPGAPSTSSSTRIPSYTHDVFLSFRGPDTREGFTGYLYDALKKKGIQTFIDEKLDSGEEIPRSLLDAIERSKVAIVVFSENFASSRWCLDELVKILERRELKQQIYRAVFYKVEPNQLRNITGRFGEALANHETIFKQKRSHADAFGDPESTVKHNMDKLAKWRNSLMVAANLSGHVYSTGSEAQFIERFVDEISKQIEYSDFNVADHPVGIKSRVQDMEIYLADAKVKEVRMIGIWGTGGLGKTTIARAIHNSLAKNYEGSCLLHVGGDLIQLQNLLLSKILPGKHVEIITDVLRGMTIIKNRLHEKKVLIILDNVNQRDQLRKLVGELNWFGSGSRIIITTRDKSLLMEHGVQLRYDLKKLNHHEAKELFSAYAFPGGCLPDEYVKLVDDVVEYAQGLPLALEEIGKHLNGKTTEEWQEELNSNSKSPQASLYEILKNSYNPLEVGVKEVFLDIACFFNGESKKHVIEVLQGAGSVKPITSIRTLEEKALIDIVKNQIWMHNVLEAMAKEMTLEPLYEPGKRTRLCFYNDVQQVLTNGEGKKKVKGVMVLSPTHTYLDSGEQPETIKLSPLSFSGMKRLKFFINRDACFAGEIKSLPKNLRLIDWPCYPFESLPMDFDPGKLVKLNMPRSHMLQLGEPFKSQSCSHLTYINLESCTSLQAIPSFSQFPKLKELNLTDCTSLNEVGDSAAPHENLVILSLSGCNNLTVFPRTISLKAATQINLSGCVMLNFPESLPDMERLTSLDMSGTSIVELPPSITHLTGLGELTLRNCENLVNLADSIYELHHLSQLDLQDCSKLVTFPRWNAESSHQTNLWHINLSGCKSLKEIPEIPPEVEWINANGCESLGRFAILSNILERRESSKMIASISLYNCRKLCGNLPHDAAGNEGSLCSLIQIQSSKQSDEFHLVFPGNRVPRWFKHQVDLENLVDKSEFAFDVPVNLNPGSKGLAICAAVTPSDNVGNCSFTANIYINGNSNPSRKFHFEAKEMERSCHVWMRYIPFVKLGFPQPPFTCKVILEHASGDSVRCTSYGVHLVMPTWTRSRKKISVITEISTF